jgi:hypothetical protein
MTTSTDSPLSTPLPSDVEPHLTYVKLLGQDDDQCARSHQAVMPPSMMNSDPVE